ncbi:YbaY family lipoprotein [Thalassospira sp. NFXS8]|uniref:YbaY family lipoprotein n=1 Tax=Thalassospira sp. NFXS8 TaxID=2819093 RepID=UPI0032DEBC49
MKISPFRWDKVRAVMALVAVLMIAACGFSVPRTDTIAGTVSYRERIAMTPSNILTVRLLDVSRADAPARVVASRSQPATNPPMSFALPYQTADIDPAHRYAVEAIVTDGAGNNLFRNETSYPVLTGGNPDAVNIDVMLLRQQPGVDKSHDEKKSATDKLTTQIDKSLSKYRKLVGQHAGNDGEGSFEAYVTENGTPVLIRQTRDLGDYGKSDVAFYFRKGALLRFDERATRANFGSTVANAGASADGLEYELQLDFAKGNYQTGEKRINGQITAPDKHEISGAQTQAKLVQTRLKAELAATEMSEPDGRQTFVCDNQSRFYATFDQEKHQVRIEFLGRDPLYLPQKRTASGFLYGNDDYTLQGKGQNATWSSLANESKTGCSVSAEIAGLILAPGDFPVVSVASLMQADNTEWTRYFDDMMPAIKACLQRPVGDLPSVLKAWPMSHGTIGVRTVNINGGRYDCLAPSTGLGDIHVEAVEGPTNILPGERDVLFTPASGAYPADDCYQHKKLEKDGVFIGWLSRNACGS